MDVRISRSLLDQILDHAAEYPDREVCGLLLGKEGLIAEVRAAANVARQPTASFEVDPAVLLSAHKAARSGGPLILGHYHSHPSGAAFPSPRDAADARPGQLWLIVAGHDAALFQARPDGPIHGCFHATGLTIEETGLHN